MSWCHNINDYSTIILSGLFFTSKRSFRSIFCASHLSTESSLQLGLIKKFLEMLAADIHNSNLYFIVVSLIIACFKELNYEAILSLMRRFNDL